MAVVGGLRSLVGLEAERRHTFRVCIRVESGIRYINTDLGRDRKRNRGEPISARTSNNNQIEPEHNHQVKEKSAENTKLASPDFSANYRP